VCVVITFRVFPAAGPKYGTLVIAGGSLPQNSTVFQEMLMLAGGPDSAKAVYFPTNGGGNYDGAAGERALMEFEELTGTIRLFLALNGLFVISISPNSFPLFCSSVKGGRM
jgi:hypothetical protein